MKSAILAFEKKIPQKSAILGIGQLPNLVVRSVLHAKSLVSCMQSKNEGMDVISHHH